MKLLFCGATAALALLCPFDAAAKPIAFAQGRTVMVEHGGSTMDEVQAFYAPRYWASFGGGALRLRGADDDTRRDIQYLRANLLVHRWNLPSAQANVFAWGGVGRARGSGFEGSLTTRNAGAQADFETRRVYASLRSDLHESDAFSHRIGTVQLGWAPYAHDYDRLATWVVVQGRQYTGGLYRGTETALLVRLFKRGAWVEFGATKDGDLQAMAMFNF